MLPDRALGKHGSWSGPSHGWVRLPAPYAGSSPRNSPPLWAWKGLWTTRMLKAGSSKMGAHLLSPVSPSTDLHSYVPRAAFSDTLPVRTTSVWVAPDSSLVCVTPSSLITPPEGL